MSRLGTLYFISSDAACTYYASLGDPNPANTVERNIAAGGIRVEVAPEVRRGEKLVIDTVEGRYYIET